jgi:Tfp pilus assembly protein FimT
VVLVLLCLAAGVALAGFDALSAVGRLRSALGSVAAIDQLARTEACVERRPRRLWFQPGTGRVLVQEPERTEGEWGWSPGRAFRWGRGVTMVAGSSELHPDTENEPLAVRFQTDGASPSYGLVLRIGDQLGVVVIDGITGGARTRMSTSREDRTPESFARSHMPWLTEEPDAVRIGGGRP